MITFWLGLVIELKRHSGLLSLKLIPEDGYSSLFALNRVCLCKQTEFLELETPLNVGECLSMLGDF